MMPPCRCRHASNRHAWWGDRPCDECSCPQYRHAETVDTITLRGADIDDDEYRLRNMVG